MTNVIWIFGDQMRAQAQGHMGDPNVSTPNIDRLAAEGVVFTAAVAGSPLCCPYRGSLLTGRYPHHIVPGHETRLPAGVPTVAHAFAAAGYRTAWFGKWHVDGWHERDGRAAFHIVPRERRGGFETWIGYENNNSQWDCWVHGHDGADDVALQRLPGFETDALTDLFIDYLRDRGEEKNQGTTRPFFAALSVQPPHDPYTAPEEYMRRHSPGRIQLRPNVPAEVAHVAEQARRELAGYYALIENLDHNLGRIREALVAAGLADDTRIVFFSDHGDMHGSHGQFRKTSPWEEAIRVPFIVGGAVPFYGAKRGRLPIPINHVDVAPTSLGLCGLPVPAEMQGFDYSARCVLGRTLPEEPDSAYLQLVVPTRHGDSIDRPWRGIVTRDGWKYIALEGQPWMLHHLRDDPYERANLAHNSRFDTERRRLDERLRRWMAETGDGGFTLPRV